MSLLIVRGGIIFSSERLYLYQIKSINDSSAESNSTSVHMIREPCYKHSGSLAIDDMFQHDNQYGFVVYEMKILMNNLPEGSYGEGHCPHLKTIRWKSLYKCVSFVIENLELFQN